MFKIAEYEALRATIRERGTARICIILVGLVAWAALTLFLSSSEFDRAAALVPFIVLTATFEISFFIHTGVERVGRYLQVFFDDDWENAAMAYAQKNPGGANPLFVTLFALTAVISFAASLPTAARHPGWIGISLLAHLTYGWRLYSARRSAAAQRSLDLDRFRALKDASSKSKELG